ncbi:hypothetical protein [Cytobacillus firmus]|uniref:hypothetical protein n=1 Tax=Cytobacillus firmus TaxID=1399 RepID=UPI001E31C0C2|nr:hypothetical protein [Cytobacillus firmus]
MNGEKTMAKILNPKDVTGTTRFLFDFDFTSTMFIQLLKEFKSGYKTLRSTSRSMKLINKEDKSVIEICNDYISFFPPLSDSEAESVRKRIYKHIAKRSEVYLSTSWENLELSVASLLTDDLRTSASLLYYSLHKFINGKMYSFFNQKLHLEDHEINFKEIEHFTSANFYLFVNRLEKSQEPLTKDNYEQVLFINRNKCIDPFMLFQSTVSEEQLADCSKHFNSYIDYLCLALFEKQYSDHELKKQLKDVVEDFIQKKESKEKTTQEEEVTAAIAFAIDKSIDETANQPLWMFYALTLRLYWLRQTADYEFDFEVKTSIREMSILASSMKYFLENQLINNREEQEITDQTDEKNTLENEALPLSKKKEPNQLDILDGDSIMYYSVDANFPSEVVFEDELYVFMTAVHLDTNFSKEHVIYALNLIDEITNRGKYFIYEINKVVKINLYIHINNDGRWTLWIPYEDRTRLISSEEVVAAFEEFLNSFKTSYKDYFGVEYQPLLVSSKPLFLNGKFDIFKTESITNLERSLFSRKYTLERSILKELSKLLNTGYRYNEIQYNDIKFKINIISYPYNAMDYIPISDMLYQKIKSKPDNLVNVNFILCELDDEEVDKTISSSNSILSVLEHEHGFNEALEQNYSIKITHEQFNDFLINQDDNYIIEKFSECLNEIAYDRIMSGKFDSMEELLRTCLSVPTSDAHPLATMGLYYLRNEAFSLEESEEKGKDFYNKAINLETHNREEYISHLKQKYNYEMAKFYIDRKNEPEKAEEYVKMSLEIGDEGLFYGDILELIESLKSEDSTKEIASALEKEVKENKQGELTLDEGDDTPKESA